MTLKDIISLFDSTASHQMAYWNVYWAVAIGILAFLWKEPRDSALKFTLVIGFIIFALSNLFIVASLQARLGDIATAVKLYLSSNPHDIDLQLRPALKGIDAVPLSLVIGFHLFVSVAFTTAMFLSRIANRPQASIASAQNDE
jgi:hypothetical protein